MAATWSALLAVATVAAMVVIFDEVRHSKPFAIQRFNESKEKKKTHAFFNSDLTKTFKVVIGWNGRRQKGKMPAEQQALVVVQLPGDEEPSKVERILHSAHQAFLPIYGGGDWFSHHIAPRAL